MTTTFRPFTRASVATSGLAVGLVCAGLGLQPTPAHANPTPAGANPRPALTSTALLQFDDIQAAGLAVDSAELGTRGDQLLGDAGRFDEGCLGEKTMRNITGAKDYPAQGEAKAYVDGTWTSTRDKDVWLSESVAEGRDRTSTYRYVRQLTEEILIVRDCEEDPAQGHHYGRARTVQTGGVTATYYLDYTSDGRSDGGGVAVIRDGNRFGFVDLMSARGKPGKVLKALAVRAARNLR